MIFHVVVETGSRSTTSCATRRTRVHLEIALAEVEKIRTLASQAVARTGADLRVGAAGHRRPPSAVVLWRGDRSGVARARCTRPVWPRCRRRRRPGRWPGSWPVWGRPIRRVSLLSWQICWRTRRRIRKTSRRSRGLSRCGSPSTWVHRDTTWWRRSPALLSGTGVPTLGAVSGIVGADGSWCVPVTVWCWWAAAPCR